MEILSRTDTTTAVFIICSYKNGLTTEVWSWEVEKAFSEAEGVVSFYGGAELIAIASDSSHDLSLLYFDLLILFF